MAFSWQAGETRWKVSIQMALSECLTYGKTALTSPFSDQEAVPAFLKMDGRAVFDFANRDVARSIRETIENGPIRSIGLGLSLASSGKYPHFG